MACLAPALGAASKDFLDLSLLRLPIDMVLLLSPAPNVGIGVGALDANGAGQLVLPIPAAPELWGFALPLQAVVIDPATLRGRWTNVRDLVIVP